LEATGFSRRILPPPLPVELAAIQGKKSTKKEKPQSNFATAIISKIVTRKKFVVGM
jgi:hypothetical protein